MNEDIRMYNLVAKSLSQHHKEHLFSFESDRRNDLLYYDALADYKRFKDYIPTEERFKAVLRHKRSRYGKRYRANKKMQAIADYRALGYTIVFGTCTFNDSQFYKANGKPIKEATRTKKINEWISSHFVWSMVNIDYGEKNEREHHHFVGVLAPTEELEEVKSRSKKGYRMYELKQKDYTLGFEPTLEIVQFDKDDIKNKKVSNYLIKINSHSNKPSTINRRFRILEYSK